MVWANQPFDLTFPRIANQRPAVAADIVKGPRLSVLVPDNEDRIIIDLQSEEVAGLWNLTRVPGKKPTRSPHALAIQLIHFIIRIKLP